MWKLCLAPVALVLLCGICAASRDRALLEADAKFVLYFGDNNGEKYESANIDEITRHRAYNQGNPTTLYIHGYKESQDSDTVNMIARAYAKRGNNNLIVLDWAVGASGPLYPMAVRQAYRIGRIMSDLLLNEFNNGYLERKNLHVVGHSLGAQMAGFIGRTMITLPGNIDKMKLQRITGLDPAGPLFFAVRPAFVEHFALEGSDAEMVDIIHTDRDFYGFSESTGTADFYPNGGTRYQPGCAANLRLTTDKDYCSHRRSVDFWAESVVQERNFDAIALKQSAPMNLLGWSKFKTNTLLDDGNVVPMGIACPATARGEYYLQTNSAAPFGRAGNGIRYDSTM